MRKHFPVLVTTFLFALSAGTVVAQDRDHQDRQNNQNNYQFSQHDQQVTHDYYNQHQSSFPNHLTSDEESRLHEGAVLDRGLRRRVRPAPADLYRQLPPPPARHRYVAIGDHVALIDNGYNVKAVIHLHDNH